MSDVPPPGPHGGDADVVARALGLDPSGVLDLSQSLNPVAPDPVPVLRRHVAAARRYPDTALATAALAEAMGVEVDRLLLTNGGAQAIALVAHELGGGVVEPEFSLHPRGAGPRWRSNPHNPTGRLARPHERAGVWDEAFYPLATGRWTRGDEATVVVGSLTKLLACPGLRLGYVLAPSDDHTIVARCVQHQPAWSVNGVAASALPELLRRVDLQDWSARVAVLRAALVGVLRSHGLVPWPSDANWVLVEAPDLRRHLARRAVVVRDCASFGLPGVARLAVPDEGGLEQLDAALARLDAPCDAARRARGAGEGIDVRSATSSPGKGTT